MVLPARLEMLTLTFLAVLSTCAHGLKIDLSRLALRRPSYFVNKRSDSGCHGNPCEAAKPFLCRSSLTCVALKYVCDGTWDCDDGFDEEPSVCNAASRPSFDDLLYLINKERHWMVPTLFNGADPELIAHSLTTANGIQDISDEVGLTPQNEDNLRKAFQAASEGDERPLLDMGMPQGAWHEIQYLLQKLLDSGFQLH